MGKEKECWENEVFGDVRLGDMDEEWLKIMGREICIDKWNDGWLRMRNEELVKRVLWGKEGGRNREGYKLGGIVLFGKEESIVKCCGWDGRDGIYGRVC